MIGRILRLVFGSGHECEATTRRLNAADAHADEAANRWIGKSLDTINASLDPGVEPYSPDQIERAIVDSLAKVRRGARRRKRSAPDGIVDDVADEALGFLDKPI